jgi:hypothetical protein
MKKLLRPTRVVTYRRYGIPAVILEGKWLTEKYRLIIGDLVDIDYQPKEIRFKKNIPLSKERQLRLKEKEEIRKRRIQELAYDTITNQDENASQRSIEVGQG